MAAFSQWRKAADQGTVKKVTWVCGAERVLVDEVTDFVRTTLQPSETDFLTFVGGKTPDREIWAGANQYPFDSSAPRLIMVREAQKVKNWAPLADWLENTRTLPTTYLLFISGEEDFARTKDKELAPHLQMIKGKGSMVRCAYPSEDDAVTWLTRYLAVPSPEVAGHILLKAGGDLGVARNVARKASVFKGRLTREVVDVLCSERASDGFVDYLLFRDKPGALKSLELLPEKDYLKTIGLLDSRLETLGLLYVGAKKGLGVKELAMSGVPVFLIKSLMPVAKYYDPGKVADCRSVLALVDQEVRKGSKVGTMESLVALW